MKYAHVRTEAVLPSGRGMLTRGTLYWEQWKGWQRGKKILAEPSAASLGVQLHVWVLLVEVLRVSGVGRGVASHSMRVYSRFLSQHLNYYFRKRAICASRFLRIRNTLPFFLLFGMFFWRCCCCCCCCYCWLCCLCLCACPLCICIWMRRGNICSLLWGAALAYAVRVGNHF